eukprot:7376500-Prymnesium_polylepis.1
MISSHDVMLTTKHYYVMVSGARARVPGPGGVGNAFLERCVTARERAAGAARPLAHEPRSTRSIAQHRAQFGSSYMPVFNRTNESSCGFA